MAEFVFRLTVESSVEIYNNKKPISSRRTSSLLAIFLNFKRQCPLRPSEIENMWHMMKNQNSPFLAHRYRMAALETWWHFQLRKYF